MDEEPVIRRAAATDLEGILSVECLCEEAPHWTPDQYAELLREPAKGLQQRAVFVVEDGQRIVGFAVASLVAREAELESVAVLPDSRRRGFGGGLCEAVLLWARENEASKIWLEVRAASLGARALYAGLGFIEAGVRKHYYTNPIDDAVLMATTL